MSCKPPESLDSSGKMNELKAEAASSALTSIRRPGLAGAFCLLGRVAYNLEGLAAVAG